MRFAIMDGDPVAYSVAPARSERGRSGAVSLQGMVAGDVGAARCWRIMFIINILKLFTEPA